MEHADLIDGKYLLTFDLNNTKLKEYEESGFKSWIYLCTDSGRDFGFEDGFHSSQGNLLRAHLPVNTSGSEFSIEQNENSLDFPWQRVFIYRKFEEILDSVVTKGPVVLSCRSSARASALLAVYKSVKHNLTKEEVFQWAAKHHFKFLESEKQVAWVEMLIHHFHKKSHHKLIFRQYLEPVSSTYTYLLADDKTKEAILIDPVLETVERDLQQIADLGLKLKYCVNTHVHADHITGSGILKQKTGCQSAISGAGGAAADILLKEFDFLQFGNWKIYAVSTPGHTNGCTSFVLDDASKVFTGDTLFIRGCGRTDFQEGSPETLYSSVHDKLFKWLPEDCALYPGHDYKGLAVSSIGEEKRLNPRLTKTKEQFVEIMKNLNLPPPKKINEAVPANLVDGNIDH